MTTVTLDAESEVLLRGLAAAAYPALGCGILVGTCKDDHFTIIDVAYGRNTLDGRHDRYTINPEDLHIATDGAHEQGLEVIGFWHSHPDASASIADTDAANVAQGNIELICATTSIGSGDVNAYFKRDDTELISVALQRTVSA